MELMFKNDCVDIFYVRTKQLLIQVWGKNYPEFSDFKEAIDKTVEFFKQFNITKLLSDTRAQPLASKKSTSYAASVVPELTDKGMIKMAFVMSYNSLVKHSVDHFRSETSNARISLFDNMDKAVLWLDAKDES